MEVAELDCGCLVPRLLWRWVTFSAVSCRWPHEFVDWKNASSKSARLSGSKLEGVLSMSEGHSTGAPKSPLVLLDRNVNGVVYRGILWDTLVLFDMQHFRDNFRYQDDNVMPHRFSVVTDYRQQEDITKMNQPAQCPHCKLHRASVGRSGACNQQHRSSRT